MNNYSLHPKLVLNLLYQKWLREKYNILKILEMNEEIDIYADVDKIHNLQVVFFSF